MPRIPYAPSRLNRLASPAPEPSPKVPDALRPAILAPDIGQYARDPNADVDGFAEWLRHLDAGRIQVR